MSCNVFVASAVALLVSLPVPGAAQTDETLWKLIELDGKAFAAEAQLTLPKDGQIRGRGPCNSFSASVEGDLSALVIGPVLATKMACPDLGPESEFFAALSEIVWAERTGDTALILGDAKSPRMVFARASQ